MRNYEQMKIVIIGISDCIPEFSEKEHLLIQGTKKFAGGKRHKLLVEPFLPLGHDWKDITVPLTGLFDEIRITKSDWVVFASGDPLFFGIGNTLQREFPDVQIEVFPSFNSLQILAHSIGLAYGEFQTISLTGRSFEEFDKALIQGVAKMGILTDRKNTPASISQRMLDFGYANYNMYYGECLGGEEERVLKLSLEEAVHLDYRHPNCFFLEKTDQQLPLKGIPEHLFESLEGRPNMITKMPIRITTLALMELQDKQVLWDVGACTGSVSIEARLLYPQLKVKTFEIRQESEGIIQRNAQQFHTPGIELYIGDFVQTVKTNIEKPDAVFLGGYGGKMEQVLDEIQFYLKDEGIIAFNSVSEKSKQGFLSWANQHEYLISKSMQITVDQFNPITILIAKKCR